MKKVVSKCVVLLIVVAMVAGFLPYQMVGILTADAYSFTGQDVNTTTNITINGNDTSADYTYVHLGSGGSSGFGANRKINIVEANLADDESLGFEVMNNGTYLKNAVPLTTVVSEYNEGSKQILAAVNGDWMSYCNSLSSSCVTSNYRVSFSSMIADGEIWCSQMTSYEQNADFFTFGVTKDRQVVIGKPKIQTTIKNVTKGTSYTATGINRAPASNTLTVFNNRLNDSNYVNTDAYEVVLQTSDNRLMNGGTLTGTVKAIYTSGTTSRGKLDNNTVVITARGSKISTISGKFAVGNTVTISTSIYDSYGNNDKWPNVDEAIGGQCLVMKNGSINNDLSGGSSDNYPTNILGYKSDKTIMMSMVTADTHGVRKGLVFNSNIDTFCKAVGYDTCLLLDGGGSTTMITLEDGNYVERACYSDGAIRSTWNSCAIVYDAGNLVVPNNVKNVVFDAEYYYAKNKDLQAFGKNPSRLFQHFYEFGLAEGRQGSPLFAIDEYINQNNDLKSAFGFASSADKETKKAKRLDALSHFSRNGAYKDASTRITSTKTADLHSEFYAKIQLTNATLNLSLSETSVIAYTPSDKPAQIWHFLKQSDGSYKIINTKNDYVLEVANGVKTSGAGIQISATDDGTTKQRWNIYEKLDYSGAVIGYTLRSVVSPACVLSVASSSPAASTAIQNNMCAQSASQVFKFEITQIVEDTPEQPPEETPDVTPTLPEGYLDIGTGFYARINTNLTTGMGLSLAAENVVLHSTKENASQLWRFERQSDSTYVIINQKTGLALTVDNNSDTDMANVSVAKYTGASGQKWYIYGDATGYEFIPACSVDKCLDVTGAVFDEATNIEIFTCHKGACQLFTLTIGNYLELAKAENIGDKFIGHITTFDASKGLALTGTNVIYKAANSSDFAQKYYFEYQPNGGYKITNLKSRYILGLNGQAKTGESIVIDTENLSEQTWFVHCKEGKYILRAEGTDSCVIGISGTNAVLSTFAEGDTTQILTVTNLGALNVETSEKTSTGVLTDAQVKAVYESLCAANTSCSSMAEATLKQQIAEYALEAYKLGVTDIDAIALCINIRVLSNSSELSRVISKVDGVYSIESIYSALLTDTDAQVGANRASHWVFYNMLLVKL